MTKDEALKLALEALKWANKEINGWLDDRGLEPEDHPEIIQAITAIKEALAQPEQEPVGYLSEGGAERLLTKKQAHEHIKNFRLFTHDVPLYTTPPQRTWIGLTDEEIEAFDTWHDNREEEVGWVNPSEIVAHIEAKLKEKNT